jgi:polynucleotide 5'-kinase involved in rRNA processing
MISSQIEVSNLITPVVNSFKIISSEWKHLFEIGVSEYLQSQTEKYYFTNTFMHRSEKVRFYDVYYPISAYYKELETNFNDQDEIFNEYKNITIIGSAGSGKSTLMKYIFLSCIKNRTRIPILIELRNLNEYN